MASRVPTTDMQHSGPNLNPLWISFVLAGRLTMDDYSQTEVEDLLRDVKDVVKASLRTELSVLPPSQPAATPHVAAELCMCPRG